MMEERFADKVKKKEVAVVDTGKIDLNKPKSFFPGDKSQNLFIIMSRLPSKPEAFILAVDNMNGLAVKAE